VRRLLLVLLALVCLAAPAAVAAPSTTSTSTGRVADEPLPDDGSHAGGGRALYVLVPILTVVAVTVTVAVIRGRRPPAGPSTR
jgi:hypothetical protein